MHLVERSSRLISRVIGIALLCFGLPAGAVLAATSGAEKAGHVCDDAARKAARDSEVPLSILRAITRVETGRQGPEGLQPWPWAVNLSGQGHWFATKDEANRFLYDAFRDGHRDFDVGCFQINYRWHGTAFASIEAMFDPVANARYAARFLTDLYLETGSWEGAVRAYHSRTPDLADRYATRFDEVMAALDGHDGYQTAARGDLSNGEGVAGPGSLVRLGSARAGSLAFVNRRGEP